MKTGFSLCGKLHRENPVLALFWPCTGLQCIKTYLKGRLKGLFKYYVIMFLTFLGPPTSLMIYSTVNHQKLQFFDVILERPLTASINATHGSTPDSRIDIVPEKFSKKIKINIGHTHFYSRVHG